MAAPLEQPTEGVVDDIDIRRSTLQVEQKRIFLNLRENSRGRYLRIAEVTSLSFALISQQSAFSCRCHRSNSTSEHIRLVFGQRAFRLGRGSVTATAL